MKFKKLKRSDSERLYKSLKKLGYPNVLAIAIRHLVKDDTEPKPAPPPAPAKRPTKSQPKTSNLSKNTDPAQHAWRVERAKKASDASIAARRARAAAEAKRGPNVAVWPTRKAGG